MPIGSAIIAGWMDTYLHVRAPSMTFLCGVILAALWFGRRVALATAFVAFFIYNFYLTEPRNTFGFAGWEDILTLLIFVGVALLIGGLAGNLHDERERAREQVRIFSGLFAASRAMAESSDPAKAMDVLTASACQIAAGQAAVLQANGEGAIVVAHASPMGANVPNELRLAAAVILEGGNAFGVRGWRLEPMPAGAKPTAVFAWQPMRSTGREHAIAVRLLVELTYIASERAVFVQRQLEMDTMAAAERLRTALMSSISHDFRTPLSTILTSASSLQTYGDQFSAATRSDLLTSIQEEAERLNRFIGNILDMTRVDAGALKPREEWTDPLEVIDNVHERLEKRLAERELAVDVPAAVPAIYVDPLLLEQAMINVVENALVHTAPEAPIRIGADYSAHRVRLWVEDGGHGVSATDLPYIFDKFHRLQNAPNNQGAGLGLAISKGFVEAMRGEVSAASPAQNGCGLRVQFEFPLQTEMASI